MPDTLVVLVSGRGALATLAGVPSVERHVKAGKALGLEVVVVYPPERRALGAEIRGIVEPGARCVPADQYAEELSRPAEEAERGPLVIAAEWYLSLAAIASVRDAAGSRAFGRVCERGCISVPVARVTRDEAASVALHLATTSAAATLAVLLDESAACVHLDAHSEQRLSDNVSTAHAEEKLVAHLFGPQKILPVLRLRPTIAPILARRLTAFDPAAISACKLAIGLAAAWIIEGGSYAEGLFGALLYFFARLVGAAGSVLARASLADDQIREKLELAGDTVLHVALLWSLAGGPARGHGAVALAAIATAGVLLSTGIAYVFVIREAWEARRLEASRGAFAAGDPAPGDAAELRPVGTFVDRSDLAPHAAFTTTGDEFVSRFVQRDGIAYGMLFAAAVGRLDLLLWAAAVASHLFYLLWLVARPRREDPTMAMGRPA
jgi:hypothetical protein